MQTNLHHPLRSGSAAIMPLAGLLLGLSGCTLFNQANPMRPAKTVAGDTVAAATMLETQADKVEQQYGAEADDVSRTRDRDSAIALRILAADKIFEDFAWNAWGTDVTVATASDWIVLGLTAAGGLATGGASQALSATAAAVTGAKTSVQKNLLYSKTVDQLLFAITVSRTQIRTHIQNCMTYPDSAYTLGAAKIDLEQYRQAAMLPLAIANLSSSPSSASTQPGCALAVSIGTLDHGTTTKRIVDWLTPGGKLDTAHRDALQTWMQTKSTNPALKHAPFQEIEHAQYEADRVQAITALNIP